ncbi:hypothetical protein BC936DRAFT_138356 [Jimgerdemannia flammicorona]|uniref:Homeodomain-like protein n=1 Tax=Jimgerdemannia flammicorona TaxID=994334 RepID=A0A433DNK7_9FUNG|nr:hypothetical protein BC936DRAFT_138356 [Jimgerdemannia flammicorona]
MAPTEHKKKRRAVEPSDTPAKSPGEPPNKKQKRDKKTPANLSPHSESKSRKNKKNKKHNDKQHDQHNRVNQSTDSSDPSHGAPVNSPDTKQMAMLSRNKNALDLLAGLASELAGKGTQEKMKEKLGLPAKPARESEENVIDLENKKGKRRKDEREKHKVSAKKESRPVASSAGSEGGGVQIRTTTGSDDESEKEAEAKRRKEKKLAKKRRNADERREKMHNGDEEADEAQKTKQNGQEMKQKGNQKHKAKTREHTDETKKKEQVKTAVIALDTTDTLMKSLMTKATSTNKKTSVTSSPLSKTLTVPKSIGRKTADQTPAEVFLANQATSARTKPTATTTITTNDIANREFTAGSTSSTGALSSSTSAKAKSGILNSERIAGASTLPQDVLHQINPLHEKWYMQPQLKVLQQQGVVIRQGKWSELENNTLRSAIDDYLKENSLNRANLEIMLFKDSAKRHPIFWRQIAAPFKDRSLRSIFHHVKQIYHPDNYGGKWTEEEDGQLKSLVMQYGHQWKRIGEILGRIGTACKDRWRDSVGHRDIKTQGKWTLEEEDKLINIVMDLTTSQGRSADSDVTWNVVSERMGTRTRDQCRSKWFVALFMSIWFSQSLRQTEISDGSLGRARKRSVASVPESRVSIATFASRTGEYETIIGDTCVVQAIKKINFNMIGASLG